MYLNYPIGIPQGQRQAAGGWRLATPEEYPRVRSALRPTPAAYFPNPKPKKYPRVKTRKNVKQSCSVLTKEENYEKTKLDACH
jgi:hypothetical protein